MTIVNAQKRILNFANKYSGKEIKVEQLNNRELYDLALTEAYLRIDAVLGYDGDVAHILTRAIDYADHHKADKFKKFKSEHKTMRILEEGERV